MSDGARPHVRRRRAVRGAGPEHAAPLVPVDGPAGPAARPAEGLPGGPDLPAQPPKPPPLSVRYTNRDVNGQRFPGGGLGVCVAIGSTPAIFSRDQAATLWQVIKAYADGEAEPTAVEVFEVIYPPDPQPPAAAPPRKKGEAKKKAGSRKKSGKR